MTARSVLPRRLASIFTLLFCVVIIALALGFGMVRTFVVDATVSGMNVQFQGQSNYWDLGTVTVCNPLEKPDIRGDRGDGKCDLRRYTESSEDISVEWQNGAIAQVEVAANTDLVLTVSAQPGMRDGTRILIPNNDWRSFGVLSFVGEASLGQPAGSGETKLVLSGSYQVREKPVWSTRTETIKTGELRKGEGIALVERQAGKHRMATVYGYISPNLTHDRAVDVGIVSQSGNVAIEIRYFGGKNAAQISPNWIDRTLSSPLILALAFVLSLGIGAAQLTMKAGVEGTASSDGWPADLRRSHFNIARKPRLTYRARRRH